MLTRLTRAILVAALTMLASHVAAQDADKVDRLNVPGPITFQNKSYSLAWSSEPSENYIKQEYVPAG
ncbi:hypothetical protein ACFOEZ_10200 [Tianweitania populi]|uniref:Uncharacterized protein n=1 Tax=Tianweitania populi TaxID=1607949 RepID=A0A8J3DZG6_9HYPH|nr:hypothetical protein [Tianweitania populi]GHD24342.1 hypothetical protein GCM10016234_40450 [Tianweitania populi]